MFTDCNFAHTCNIIFFCRWYFVLTFYVLFNSLLSTYILCQYYFFFFQKSGVRISDIPYDGQLPRGIWRLGVPCPNTKALLLRFASSDDVDKAHQLRRKQKSSNEAGALDDERTSQWDEDRRRKKSRREDDEERRQAAKEERRMRKANKRLLEGGVKARLHNPKIPHAPVGGAMSLYQAPRPPPYLPHLPPSVERSYRDLDDPIPEVDSRNPWGDLAQNWGKKETGPGLDYQALLSTHRTATTSDDRKRKRDSDDEMDHDGPRQYRKLAPTSRHGPDSRRRVGQRYADSGGDDRYRSDEEEEDSSHSDASDDVVSWNTKMRLPRMKMYADVEEKRKKVKPKRRKPLEERREPKDRNVSPKKSRGSIFSRLGGGDGPDKRQLSNRQYREFDDYEDREVDQRAPRRQGGMRSEVHGGGRDVRSRLGGLSSRR